MSKNLNSCEFSYGGQVSRILVMDENRLLTSTDIAKLRRNLRRWHRRHGRDLPWRDIGDPYRVWISEIMLQQTTVVAVVPYYERFFERFPTVESLAEADQSEVLRMWEGLGYYSRARNIHKAARQIVSDWEGNLPADVDQLQSLPGIGRYTAGAIASFAFDRPAPIVEANTLRLYCRLLGFGGDPRSAAGQRFLWSFAEQLVPRKQPGEFNQALMDLGATICTPTEPDCPGCPLRPVCRAFAECRVASIPRPAQRVAITPVTEASIAVHRRGTYLLRQRSNDERWAGMWDFLRFELPAGVTNGQALSSQVERRLVEMVREQASVDVDTPRTLQTLQHSVTRYRITLLCQTAQYVRGRLRPNGIPMKWVRPGQFECYPLSVTARRFAQILVANHRQL